MALEAMKSKCKPSVLAYWAYVLKPIVPKLKLYVKDTTDFVKQIRKIGQVSKETLLVTFDVLSLYTNIPNHEGMQACAKALSESIRQSSLPCLVFLRQLLRMVL